MGTTPVIMEYIGCETYRLLYLPEAKLSAKKNFFFTCILLSHLHFVANFKNFILSSWTLMYSTSVVNYYIIYVFSFVKLLIKKFLSVSVSPGLSTNFL